jgi:hypothetical protein
MFDESAIDPPGAAEALWEQIHDLYLMAERCHNHHKDENAWVEVVRAMLKIAGIGSTNAMLEINSV